MPQQDQPLAQSLREVLVRVEDLLGAEERVRSLLEAVNAIAGDLDLHSTLQRIVTAAAELADAQYAALGVIHPSGEGLIDFITHGMPGDLVTSIGALPRGHGILGLIIKEPHPLRLHDLHENPASYGFPAHHPPMRTFLGVPVRVRGRVFGNLYLTEKLGGGDFTIDDEHAVKALAGAAGVAIQNARLFERLTRRERWLSAASEIQQALLGHIEIGAALALIAERAQEAMSADLALVVLEHPAGELRVEAAAGCRAELLDTTLPREGPLSDVVEHGATVISGEGLRLPGLEGVQAAVLVPFTGPRGAGGALLIGRTESGLAQIDDDDMQALRGFAAQASLGVDKAQAQEDRASLAVLADRDRIGRDLHDLVIQRLFATGLTLQSVARRPENAALAASLQSTVTDLDATITDIRSTIFQLGRADADSGVRSQVLDAVAAAEPTLGFKPRVQMSGPVDSVVPEHIRTHLIAVIVEALSNVGRHARASEVEVAVRIEVDGDGDGHAGAVVVRVSDDGRGFTGKHRGNGLRNLRQRARDLSGTCEITASPGHGATVVWSVPLPRTG